MSLDDSRSDFDSLRPGQSTEQGATRRTALKAAIGVGYAAAVMPVMAQTAISTSAEGLKAGPIKYTVNGFEVRAARCDEYAQIPALGNRVEIDCRRISQLFAIADRLIRRVWYFDRCRRAWGRVRRSRLRGTRAGAEQAGSHDDRQEAAHQGDSPMSARMQE